MLQVKQEDEAHEGESLDKTTSAQKLISANKYPMRVKF
jgi:hypothetical protein